MHTRFSVLAMAATAALAASAAAQTPISAAHYFTFDDAPLGLIGQADVYTPVSPERFTYFADQVIGFAPTSAGTDGVEVVAASAEALQGGQMINVDPTTEGSDEGLWVEMTQPFLLGDVTVEAMFLTRDLNPAGQTVGLQYVVATEVPGASAQFFQGQLRILGDGGAVGRPADTGKLEWNSGQPGGLPEVRVTTVGALAVDTWYHVVGVLDYNESDPANSEMRLYLGTNAVATLGDLQGSTTVNLSEPAPDPPFEVTSAWGVPFSPAQDVNYSPNLDLKPRYFIGSSPNNAISGSDRRALVGLIDAVCVTAQAGEIYLPDAPPIPPITATGDWSIYR